MQKPLSLNNSVLSGENNSSSNRTLLLESGLVVLLATGVAVSMVQPVVSAILVAAAVLLFLSCAPLRHQVNLVCCFMMLDLQRQVGGTWVYVDLSFILLLAPLILRRQLPRFWWVFIPYTIFLLVDGIPRALVPAWYAGFALRSSVAVLVYLAAALASVEETYFIIVGVSLIPLVAYGAYQLYIGDFGELYAWVNPHMLMPWTGRAYSLLWQPNAFGGVCSLAITSFVALAISNIRPKLYYTFTAITFVGMLCSGSRGALIATFVGVSLAAWVRQRTKLIFIPVILALVIVVAGNFFEVPFIQRLGQGDKESNEGRNLGNELGIRSFLQHPLIGVGPTNFEVILPTEHEWGYTNTMTVNNIYIQHLAEMGLIGFVAFWVPFGCLMLAAWRQRTDAVVLAGLCSLVAFAVHGLFDYHFEFGPHYLFLFYASSGVLAGRIARLTSHMTAQESRPLFDAMIFSNHRRYVE